MCDSVKEIKGESDIHSYIRRNILPSKTYACMYGNVRGGESAGDGDAASV